jgi:hypothetical protein
MKDNPCNNAYKNIWLNDTKNRHSWNRLIRMNCFPTSLLDDLSGIPNRQEIQLSYILTAYYLHFITDIWRITSNSKYENLTVYTGHLVLTGQSIRGGSEGLTVHTARMRTRKAEFWRQNLEENNFEWLERKWVDNFNVDFSNLQGRRNLLSTGSEEMFCYLWLWTLGFCNRNVG